ncbi:MAG: M20/M25/M40 family metallo-hydrolase [Chloroflexi bacterium]|nr:M20/M25/M40 family metallo-hydrolase [Chloroflexota bacterium]
MNAMITQRVLDLACSIQQIASPTLFESRRAEFIRDQFAKEGLADASLDAAGNALARLPGAGNAPPLVVSAHLDTVFPQETNLHLRRQEDHIYGPGIGDNSLGLASLFGLVWMLRDAHIVLPADVWLAADVGEEGLGNLRGMRAVVDRFGNTPVAYVILEGMGLGEVFHRGLGVQRYRISVQTEGGHSWNDYGRPSAIHELACLVTQLITLPIPHDPRTSINVGVITGGTSVNTIAAKASLDLDLRSESHSTLSGLTLQVETLVRNANRPGVRTVCENIGRRPSGEIPIDHPLVKLAMQTLRGLKITPTPGIGSTDANVPLSLGFPAICIAMTTGSGSHTPAEFIRTGPLAKGLEQLFLIATKVWQIESA